MYILRDRVFVMFLCKVFFIVRAFFTLMKITYLLTYLLTMLTPNVYCTPVGCSTDELNLPVPLSQPVNGFAALLRTRNSLIRAPSRPASRRVGASHSSTRKRGCVERFRSFDVRAACRATQ